METSFFPLLIPLSFLAVLGGCASGTSVDQGSSSVASSSVAVEANYSSYPEPFSSAASVTYRRTVCGAEVPSTWHERSRGDQAIWNREGNSEPPVAITADVVLREIRQGETLPHKPAVFSIADSDTLLPGHADDPGAEDSNSTEIDMLEVSGSEMGILLEQLPKELPDALKLETVMLDGQTVQVLRDLFEGGKYFGQEVYFLTPLQLGSDRGFIVFNRSNAYEDPLTTEFRQGFRHFLNTIHLKECDVSLPRLSQLKAEQISPGEGYGVLLESFNNEPFNISIGSLPLRIFKQHAQVARLIQEELVERAEECGPARPAGYFEGLRDRFRGLISSTYTIQFESGPHQGSWYRISLLPNIPRYKTMEEFNGDFFRCGVGGPFPFTLNQDWLVFTTSCGGVDEGCGQIKDAVEPTIRLR